MKVQVFFIISSVAVTICCSLFLLIFTVYKKLFFMLVNILTGFALLAILFITAWSRGQLKRKQQNYIHEIFSKN
jgi:uncharacterized protein YpmS